MRRGGTTAKPLPQDQSICGGLHPLCQACCTQVPTSHLSIKQEILGQGDWPTTEYAISCDHPKELPPPHD